MFVFIAAAGDDLFEDDPEEEEATLSKKIDKLVIPFLEEHKLI